MANDIIDINVYETTETVEITVNPNLTTVNINKVTGGGGGGATDLAYIPSPTNGTVTSSTGTSATIPLADGTNAGLITPAEKTKIANSVPYTGATTNVNLGEFEIKAGQVTLDTTPTGTAAVATTRWNDALGSSETTLKGGTVVLKNGVDLVARIVNKVTPNTTLTKAAYQAVRISGAQGQRLAVELAQGNNDNNSADTIGLVTETIATNQEGFIITMGQIENINTTGSLQSETWVDGDVLYLSPTVAGRLTNIKPIGATGHIVVIGYVEYSHAINGKIYVKIMNGWELDELHNIYINNPLNNEGLFYETSTSLWKNKSIATVLGYTPANDSNVVHLTGEENITGVKYFTNGVRVGTNTQFFEYFGYPYITSDNGKTITIGNGPGLSQNNLSVANGTFNIELQTANTIASFDASKNVVSLPIATYPSLTELSYVKGVTSAIQTQLNGKVSTNTAITGATNTKITYDAKGLVTAGTTLIESDIPTLSQSKVTNLTTDLSGKQATLQSTVNIKSVNGNSLLGSGDLTISGGAQSAYTILANNTNASAVPTEQIYKSIGEQTYSASPTWSGTAPQTILANTYRWLQIGNMVTIRINLSYNTGGSNAQVTLPLPADLPNPETITGFTLASEILGSGAGTFNTSTTAIATAARGCFLRRNTANNGYEFIVAGATAISIKTVSLTLTYFA